MDKIKIILLIFIIIILAIVAFSQKSYFQKTSTTKEYNIITTTENNKLPSKQVFVSPINNPLSRITKKPFGIYISSTNSPVSPEKFTGYHTGVDFEIYPTEKDEDVSVRAICGGKILQKHQARGYGGMVVQSCTIDNNSVTIVYGHIKLSSMKIAVGDTLNAGDFLAFLGQEFSVETDGERKHLHLGIHKGSTIDTRGYVQTKDELENWIDIQKFLFPPID
ncbi:MAG: M23 family metallopeptidase [Candidatus Paceibacterota bacterium]